MNIEDYKNYVARNRKGNKPSSEKAQDALKRLIDLIFVYGDEELISQAVLHMPVLLDYFTPSIGSRAKMDALAWAQLATDPKATAQYKKQVFAYGGDAVGAHGPRMHIAKGRAKGMPEGTVFFADGSTSFIDGFCTPPCEKLIPSMEERESVSITSRTIEGIGKERYYKLTFSNGEFGKYKALYFEELTLIGENTLFTTRKGLDKSNTEVGPIIGIDTDTRLGLLMPVRHG